MIKNFIKDESGQGMVEYILIIALIAIAVIVGIRFFGEELSDLFKEAIKKIKGEM